MIPHILFSTVYWISPVHGCSTSFEWVQSSAILDTLESSPWRCNILFSDESKMGVPLSGAAWMHKASIYMHGCHISDIRLLIIIKGHYVYMMSLHV